MNNKAQAIIIILLIAVLTVGVFGCSIDTTKTKTESTEVCVIEKYDSGIVINASEVEMLAKMVYGEARGCSRLHQSAVIWCVLNRVDAGGGSIEDVITAPNQFVGYNSNTPVTDDIKALVEDVLIRWQMEKKCCGDVGRTLPPEYRWFYGDGKVNYFRDAYKGDYNTWDWSLENPYD